MQNGREKLVLVWFDLAWVKLRDPISHLLMAGAVHA